MYSRFLVAFSVFCSFSIFVNIKKVQHEQSATGENCNMQRVQRKKNAKRKRCIVLKCNTKRVQHEQTPTGENCNMERVQQQKNSKRKYCNV